MFSGEKVVYIGLDSPQSGLAAIAFGPAREVTFNLKLGTRVTLHTLLKGTVAPVQNWLKVACMKRSLH